MTSSIWSSSISPVAVSTETTFGNNDQPSIIAGLASEQMSQCHLTPGLAGLFLDLVPMIKDFAQDLVGQRALGAGWRRQKSTHGTSNLF